MTRPSYIALHVVPMVLLVAAVARWPYGYYTLLRFAVCVAAAWLAVIDYQRGKTATAWVIALGLIAILFNPIVPVYLSRDVWFILDLGTAAAIGGHLWVSWRLAGD